MTISGVFLTALTDLGPEVILLQTEGIILSDKEQIDLAIKSMPVSGKKGDFIIVSVDRYQIIALLLEIPPFGTMQDKRNTYASIGFITEHEESPVEYRSALEKITKAIIEADCSNIETLKDVVKQLFEINKKRQGEIVLPNNSKIKIALPKFKKRGLKILDEALW